MQPSSQRWQLLLPLLALLLGLTTAFRAPIPSRGSKNPGQSNRCTHKLHVQAAAASAAGPLIRSTDRPNHLNHMHPHTPHTHPTQPPQPQHGSRGGAGGGGRRWRCFQVRS